MHLCYIDNFMLFFNAFVKNRNNNNQCKFTLGKTEIRRLCVRHKGAGIFVHKMRWVQLLAAFRLVNTF